MKATAVSGSLPPGYMQEAASLTSGWWEENGSQRGEVSGGAERTAGMTGEEKPAESSPGWHLGTSGLAFDGWKGTFYPAGMPSSKWLSFYAQNFTCLELNTTFYATPSAERMRQWVETAGPAFWFTAKAPKAITHDAPLSQGAGLFRRFAEEVAAFGSSLGVVLLQFPPAVTVEQLPALERLLAAWDSPVRLAVEFRSASWIHRETETLLREREVAWVGLEHDDCPPMARIVPTTDFLYVRLVGKHGRFATESHELFDPTEELEVWFNRISSAIVATEQDETPTIRDVYVMFNNDFAGHGPATLRRFATMAGVGLPTPPVVKTQKRLF